MATVDDVELELVGSEVSFIGFDFQITLRFSNSSVVQLESLFSVTGSDGKKILIDPEGSKEDLVSVLNLHGQHVTSAEISGSVLNIVFANGTKLEAKPDSKYESWSYTGPGELSTRVITMPGGELAIWLRQE